MSGTGTLRAAALCHAGTGRHGRCHPGGRLLPEAPATRLATNHGFQVTQPLASGISQRRYFDYENSSDSSRNQETRSERARSSRQGGEPEALCQDTTRRPAGAGGGAAREGVLEGGELGVTGRSHPRGRPCLTCTQRGTPPSLSQTRGPVSRPDPSEAGPRAPCETGPRWQGVPSSPDGWAEVGRVLRLTGSEQSCV